MSYTKAPWKIKLSRDKHETPSIVADGPDTPGIINICRLNDCGSHKEIYGNAELIAAVPDMYEILKRVKELIDSGDWQLPEGFCETEINQINSALAKAEGK